MFDTKHPLVAQAFNVVQQEQLRLIGLRVVADRIRGARRNAWRNRVVREVEQGNMDVVQRMRDEGYYSDPITDNDIAWWLDAHKLDPHR
jgi:hypothetical protein